MNESIKKSQVSKAMLILLFHWGHEHNAYIILQRNLIFFSSQDIKKK